MSRPPKNAAAPGAVLAGALIVSVIPSLGCPLQQQDPSGIGPPVGGDVDAGPRPRREGTCPPTPGVGKSLGEPCACSLECNSTFCVDGVCCDRNCDGICLACNVPSSPGKCAPVPAGMPPAAADQCKTDPVASCGLDGTCDGAGKCRKYPENTPCGPGKCESGAVSLMACNGGSCKGGVTITCAPFACDADRGQCFAGCTADGQCQGHKCEGGSCGKKPFGAACQSKDECQSGFCADGVCCNVACSGPCLACNQVGKMGQCVPTEAGSPDPHGACKRQEPSTCGSSGLCTGRGACANFAAGTTCRAASCSGAKLNPSAACDGQGACLTSPSVDCAPFACAANQCKLACAAPEDCVGGASCTKGSCGHKGLGQGCTAASQCASGYCVDGVCCAEACAGTCSTCAYPTALGRCTPGSAGDWDPRGGCPDRGVEACGTNGRCDGRGGCEIYANGTTCGAGSCDGTSNQATGDAVCDNGGCKRAAATTCAPFRCNGSRCAFSCGRDEDCAGANTCSSGSCGKKKEGALCAQPAECVSGICAQGRCCVPVAETCNGRDDDCNGQIDEGLTRGCTSACGNGTETCSAGNWYGCTAPLPTGEVCDGRDNDCNGRIDDGLSRACGTACGSGTETCAGGVWQGCTAPQPTAEVCDGIDNDCNGAFDEPCRAPCYRLYQPVTGDHFYTLSAEERDFAVSVVGYSYEGVAWSMYGGPVAGTAPLYRLLWGPAGIHYYTTDANGRGQLIAGGWTDEGIAGYVLAANPAGTVPLHALYYVSGSYFAWFFTASAAERDAVVAGGWTYAGVIGYVFP